MGIRTASFEHPLDEKSPALTKSFLITPFLLLIYDAKTRVNCLLLKLNVFPSLQTAYLAFFINVSVISTIVMDHFKRHSDYFMFY